MQLNLFPQKPKIKGITKKDLMHRALKWRFNQPAGLYVVWRGEFKAWIYRLGIYDNYKKPSIFYNFKSITLK